MIKLSNGAREYLDRYLQQIRAYLRGCKTVDADEVERNVIEHIDSEFEGATAAVSFEQLDAVLKRLGSPRQWIPAEELPWWRKIIVRLRSGSEDWRLAYLSFGLLILACLFFIYDRETISYVLIPASFVIARAALSEAGGPNELKAQKWLLYPSLIIVYVFALSAILTWPLGLLIPLALEYEQNAGDYYPQFRDALRYWTVASSFIIAATGAWWAVLGAVFLKWRNLQSVLFRPFGGLFKTKWSVTLLLVGLGLAVVSAGFGLWYFG